MLAEITQVVGVLEKHPIRPAIAYRYKACMIRIIRLPPGIRSQAGDVAYYLGPAAPGCQHSVYVGLGVKVSTAKGRRALKSLTSLSRSRRSRRDGRLGARW